ncbi:MAG: hypothetical protein ACR2P9_07630 [Gammaproteobacteria bacterium]
MKTCLFFLCFAFSLVGCGDTSEAGSTTSAGNTRSLSELLADGVVQLVSLRGTGGSTGTVLEGRLLNTTNRSLKIDTLLSPAIYFMNHGRGQNMVATAIYGRGGAYYTDARSNRQYITLNSKTENDVVFWAYCADLYKDNPQTHETLSIGTPPPVIANVAEKIRIHQGKITSSQVNDFMIAAQLVLWLAQGETLDEISRKYKFDSRHTAIAQDILETPSTLP